MDSDEERPLVESEKLLLDDSEKRLAEGKKESATDGTGESLEEEEGEQRKRDFQTIHVPGSGGAVSRAGNLPVTCILAPCLFSAANIQPAQVVGVHGAGVLDEHRVPGPGQHRVGSAGRRSGGVPGGARGEGRGTKYIGVSNY